MKIINWLFREKYRTQIANYPNFNKVMVVLLILYAIVKILNI